MKENKNKKSLIIIGGVILLIAIFTIAYVILTTPDKNTALTVLEKRWVEQNKNKIINIAVLNDIPIYGYEGKGLIFDFLNDFEKDIKLEFNKVSYNHGDTPSLYDYKFEIVENVDDNQIPIYQDYYVALSKEKIRVKNISEFNNKKIGILNDKLDNVKFYVGEDNQNYITKEKVTDLFKALESEEVDYIIVPYNNSLNEILTNNYYISYNFKDISDSYVITLNADNSNVNNILKKYFELWKTNEMTAYYSNELTKLYYDKKNISNKKQADFNSKTYVYGYIENLPFESVINGTLIGINGEYIRSFSEITNIDFELKKFNSISDLVSAFNSGKIDIMFNNISAESNLSNSYETLAVYNEDYVIITNYSNSKVFDSIKSLNNETIYMQKDSKLVNFVNKNVEATIKTYTNINKLLKNLNEDMIIVMDYDTYNYYKNDNLEKFNISYIGNTNFSYGFQIKKDNELLSSLFDYHISSINYKNVKNNAYRTLIINPKNETILQTLINYILYIVLPIIVFIIIIIILIKRKKKKDVIKKDEKLRYIDMLTSLKNRNYLNKSIPEWDEATVYPQTIVIVDLNNIKYVNDNFGHEEGDNVIKCASNILIKTQKENTDIVRTDGNEFLIYLVGYTEDEIISYMKKLYKEMKELPHGFGAAFGYSMINDDTKLIDDAINEATLDMRTNKES